MHYATFLLDKDRFLQSSRRHIEAADKGNFNPAVSQAREHLSSLGGSKWVLEGLGTSAEEIDHLDAVNQLAGFAFLVLVSRHLRALPLENRRLEIDRLAEALVDAGWDEEVCRLLAEGNSVPYLLKPEASADRGDRPSADDPRWNDPRYYWWWARPLNAFRAGWWDTTQLMELRGRLASAKPSIEIKGAQILSYHSTASSLFDTALHQGRAVLFICS